MLKRYFSYVRYVAVCKTIVAGEEGKSRTIKNIYAYVIMS